MDPADRRVRALHELGRLRWYLEDYLASPYRVSEGREPQIAAGLAGGTSKLFDTVFGAGAA